MCLLKMSNVKGYSADADFVRTIFKKGLFFEKNKHIAHEGFCRKNKHNMGLAKASAKKFMCL